MKAVHCRDNISASSYLAELVKSTRRYTSSLSVCTHWELGSGGWWEKKLPGTATGLASLSRATESEYIARPGNMTTSSPELSEMADIFPSESWTDSQLETGTALRPHAQAHLLSSTENCKVNFVLASPGEVGQSTAVTSPIAATNRNLINLFHLQTVLSQA